MAKGSGTTRSGSSRNPRGSSSGFNSVRDYFVNGSSDRLAKRMNTVDKMEKEVEQYLKTVSRATGADTSGGDWTYNTDVYTNVFGNGFSYSNDRLQNEGIQNAIRKAVTNMSEREKAAFVLANPNHDRSVYSQNLNPNNGSSRTPFGPYDDDVEASSLMRKTKEQRKEFFNNWRKNLKNMTFDGAFYSR